ncbi:U32 family peptidase [uncultured Oscillibacter sp.]|uniref:peptidase U32 family protein n=1 Tax=uncultured Oscillibacter sp. TaxID=876091 RepID=UPI002621CBC6|nr:U32 family peptidase [uncultured Oscillibacter sp.]
MRPELLAPAGSPEALRAAAEGGAGAVYLGWGAFNARRGAQNFSQEEFAQAVAWCHVRGVRVFLTLNILLSDRELPEALETARTASRLGVDAVLVQDWGLFDLLRRTLPDLPLHASTQMSVFTSGGACEIAADGCERVVLARECSKEETAAICASCPAQVEAFVHGALCMCYSGQCAMSALIGGRSGNRGRCAQPCRLPYGVNEAAGNQRPLSLKDSCMADHLGEMAEMGVACLKIEGRMKSPGYVSAVTNVYARLLEEGRKPTAQERETLERAFSRSGFTDAYWRGTKGPEMLGFRPENAEAAPAVEAPRREEGRVPVRFTCRVEAGKPCLLTAEDPEGRAVTVSGPLPEAARNRALTPEDLAARLGKTGGTPYRCARADAYAGPGLSLSAAAVNALRREALESLSAARSQPPKRREHFPPPPLPELDRCRFLPHANMIVQRDETNVVALVPGRLEMEPYAHTAEKYSKFAYSSRFGFSIARANLELGQMAPDSVLCFKVGKYYYSRDVAEPGYSIGPGGMETCWSPLEGIRVRTTIEPTPKGHVRTHVIESGFDCEAYDGGFAINASDFEPSSREAEGARATSRCGEDFCTVTALEGGGRGEVLIPDPNTNVIFPKTAIPMAVYSIKKGTQTIRTQVDYFD